MKGMMILGRLFLTLFVPALVHASSLELSNETLSIRTSSETRPLLHYFGQKEPAINQLREAQKESGLLAGLNSGPAQCEGLQIAIGLKDGSKAPLDWQLKEATAHTLRFRDAFDQFEAVLSLQPSVNAVDLVIQALPGAKLYQSLELTWGLQVGGDFMAVTTEGVADVEMIPTLDPASGVASLHFGEISRHQDTLYTLSQSWFAVSDRNRATTFGVWFNQPNATLKSWSGQLLGSEAMTHTLSLPALSSPLHLRMMLFEPLEKVAALLYEGAIQRKDHRTVVFHPAQALDQGELRLVRRSGQGHELLLKTPMDGKSRQPQALSMKHLPEDGQRLTFELHSGEDVKQITLLRLGTAGSCRDFFVRGDRRPLPYCIDGLPGPDHHCTNPATVASNTMPFPFTPALSGSRSMDDRS